MLWCGSPQFLKAFKLREPMKRDVAEKLHTIALRLHRPKSIWWSYLDNAVSEGPKNGALSLAPVAGILLCHCFCCVVVVVVV